MICLILVNARESRRTIKYKKNPETGETLRTRNKTKTYKAKNSTIILKKISNIKQKETEVNSGARGGLAVPGTRMVKSGNILFGDRGKKTKTK